MNLLDQDRFVEGFRLWISRKDTPLAALALEQGWISSADRLEVERRVRQQLREAGGDVRSVLAGAGEPALRALVRLNDRDIQRALGYLALPAPPAPPSKPTLPAVPIPDPPVQPVPVPADEIKYQIVSSDGPLPVERSGNADWTRTRRAEPLPNADWPRDLRRTGPGGPAAPGRQPPVSWTPGARVTVICLAILSALALVGLVVAIGLAVQGRNRFKQLEAERWFKQHEMEQKSQEAARERQRAQDLAQALEQERTRAQQLQQQANQANWDAQQKRGLVQIHQRLADANFQAALAALERQYTAVRRKRLLPPPGQEQATLQETRAFIQKAVGETGLMTPGSRVLLAQTCGRLAQVARETGPMTEALTLAQQGLGVWHGLANHFPGMVYYRSELAAAHQRLALLYQANGQTPQADLALRRALACWGNLAATPFYRFSYANCMADLGRLQSGRQPANAVRSFDQALTALDRLSRDFPQQTEYRAARAQCQTDLVRVQLGFGQPAKAEELLKNARETQSQLVEKQPTAPHLGNLAATYEVLGRLSAAASPAKAQKAYEKAVELRTKAARTAPGEITPQAALANSYNILGLFFYEQEDRVARAETALNRARVLRAKLAADYPEVLEYARDLGGSYCNLGLLNFKAGKYEAALAWYNKGRDLLDATLNKSRQYPNVRFFLRNVYWGRARALTRLGRHQEALKDWDLALAQDQGSGNTWLQIGKSWTLAHQGEHSRAAAAASAGAANAAHLPYHFYELACVYSLAAGAASKDKKLAEAERKKQAAAYAARAMEWLRKAHRDGLFKTPALRKKLKNDTDLDALRKRADFQKLLKELDEKKAEGK
jgi:tetratricopeptide (TPR) repeat protein